MGMDVGGKGGPQSDINITPLVDVVLVLLIIFMVLTPLMEKELGVRVPEELPPEVAQRAPAARPDAGGVQGRRVGHLAPQQRDADRRDRQDRLKAYYSVAKSKEATQGPPVIFFDADDKAKYRAGGEGAGRHPRLLERVDHRDDDREHQERGGAARCDTRRATGRDAPGLVRRPEPPNSFSDVGFEGASSWTQDSRLSALSGSGSGSGPGLGEFDVPGRQRRLASLV